MNFLKLLALCTFMFFSSFLVGLIPLTFSIPARFMRLLTTAGVGLLIGVAFIVIIPEGIHTYYSQPHGHSHGHAHTHSVSEPIEHSHSIVEPILPINQTLAHPINHTHSIVQQSVNQTLNQLPPIKAKRHLLQHDHDHEHEHEHEESTESTIQSSKQSLAQHSTRSSVKPCTKPQDRSLIGLSLIAGFILMLIVERMSGGHAHEAAINTSVNHSNNHSLDNSMLDSHPERSPHKQLIEIPVDTLAIPSLTLPQPSPPSTPSLAGISAPNKQNTQPVNQSALLGILLHSAIDGLAMGAISVSEESGLEWVVFLAIVLHKGPAALGLSSFLLMQKRTIKQIRMSLAIFSAAAPFTAITTYLFFWHASFIAQATGQSADQSLHSTAPSSQTLGLCLIFSAGTFLFTIAAHILPEIGKGGQQQDIKYLICLIGGCLAPLLFSSAHHH